MIAFFFFQAEDGIRDSSVTGVQTCALPIYAKYIQGNISGFELSTWVWLKVSTVPLGSGDVSLNVLGVPGGVGVLGWDPVPPHAVNTDTNNPATANKTWRRFIAYMALWFRRRPGNWRSATRPEIWICLQVDNTGGSIKLPYSDRKSRRNGARFIRVEVATACI